jgi:hypothetical protein
MSYVSHMILVVLNQTLIHLQLDIIDLELFSQQFIAA